LSYWCKIRESFEYLFIVEWHYLGYLQRWVYSKIEVFTKIFIKISLLKSEILFQLSKILVLLFRKASYNQEGIASWFWCNLRLLTKRYPSSVLIFQIWVQPKFQFLNDCKVVYKRTICQRSFFHQFLKFLKVDDIRNSHISEFLIRN